MARSLRAGIRNNVINDLEKLKAFPHPRDEKQNQNMWVGYCIDQQFPHSFRNAYTETVNRFIVNQLKECSTMDMCIMYLDTSDVENDLVELERQPYIPDPISQTIPVNDEAIKEQIRGELEQAADEYYNSHIDKNIYQLLNEFALEERAELEIEKAVVIEIIPPEHKTIANSVVPDEQNITTKVKPKKLALSLSRKVIRLIIFAIVSAGATTLLFYCYVINKPWEHWDDYYIWGGMPILAFFISNVVRDISPSTRFARVWTISMSLINLVLWLVLFWFSPAMPDHIFYYSIASLMMCMFAGAMIGPVYMRD